jgi:hypothetical protein
MEELSEERGSVEDEEVVALVRRVNQEFLRCANRQAQCLLEASVDSHNTLTTLLIISLAFPMLKAVLLEHFDWLPW